MSDLIANARRDAAFAGILVGTISPGTETGLCMPGTAVGGSAQ